MNDIHNRERELELSNNAFKQSEYVSDANKQAVSDFINKCYAEGLSTTRVSKYVSNFHTLLKMADKDFELLDSDQDDLEVLAARIERSNYAETTKIDFKTALKKFYKVMEGDGREYPDKVDFMSTTLSNSDKKVPEILEREEVEAIIDACRNDRDRAMYKLLYEAGIRAGELMGMRVKDVDFKEHGVKIRVKSTTGKTGFRRILVVESERYLRSWLSKHPAKNRRNAPLWVKNERWSCKTCGEIKSKHNSAEACDSYEPDYTDPISYDQMRMNLKRKAVDAGILETTTDSGRKTSEVTPHMLRHSRATALSTEMTEAAMKEYFGWYQGSDMPQVYVHLSGRDIDKEILKMYGIEDEEDKVEKRECSRCFKEYQGKESFCPRCGAPLDQKSAMEAEEARQHTDTLANALVSGDLTKEDLRNLAERMSS